MSNWYSMFVSDRNSPYKFDNLYKNYIEPFARDLLGYTQMKNTQASTTAQMDYEQYLKAGNERALADWHKNVPNREIKYPEFSYPGQIYRADTALTRAGLDYDTSRANYTGNLLYRSAGLYGIGTRLFRRM